MPKGLTLSTAQGNDEKSSFKLAQLWWYVNFRLQCEGSEDVYKRIIDRLLAAEDFNVSYNIERNPEVEGNDRLDERACTALHMLASDQFHIDNFNSLLDRGVDFTMKNRKGQTALHLLLEVYSTFPIVCNDQAPYIKSILSAHVKYQNPVNPRDSNGLSHFHAACITNQVEVLNWFLDNGATVNETVDLDSPYFPGYTPLHFAALFDSFEAAQLLVDNGANINAEDARSMTPMDVLVERRFDKMEPFMRTRLIEDKKFREARLKDNANNEKMIKMLLEKQSCRLSGVGLSRIHMACTLTDLSIAESLLDDIIDIDDVVPMESPVFPGYTISHLAALNSVEAVKLLLAHDAQFDVEGADGLTPLDICVSRYSVQDIYRVLFHMNDFEEICMTDGRTKLLDLVLSIKDVNQFKSLLQDDVIGKVIPKDSAFWPGSTLLHLAVISSTKNERSRHYDEAMVKECLKHHLNVDAPNARGQTPIHLAFRLGKGNIVSLLIRHLCQFEDVENYVDDDNLSYLHIACSVSHVNFAKILLEHSEPSIVYTGKRIPKGRIEPGFTPLHVAVIRGSTIIVQMLLTRGANLHAVDCYGLTPIHWLLTVTTDYSITIRTVPPVATILIETLLQNPEDRLVERMGLSYLHVACFFGGAEIIKRLLDLGSNIDAVINVEGNSSYWERRFENRPLAILGGFSGLTPLHCALQNPNIEAVETLLRHGADVFAKLSSSPADNGISLKKLDVVRKFVPCLWHNDEMQQFAEKRFGMTKLHVACYMKNEEYVKSVLTQGINVNAQIHADSVIFAGCTPLHLLLTGHILDYEYFAVGSMINLLLDNGADVTTTNAAGNTPIHLFYKYRQRFTDRDFCQNILFSALRDFDLNPVNSDGMSHFHLACYWHQAETVERFLQRGSVDVNGHIDFFAKENPGCTPLHLALDHNVIWLDHNWTKLSQIVDSLLKHGANVAAKDVRGETPLHKRAVLSSSGMSIIEKLVSHGADMKSENVRGETPVELWTSTHLSGYARIFEIIDYQLNSWNRLSEQGYIARFFLTRNQDIMRSSEFNKWINSPDAKLVDEMGRTAIYNSVAISHRFHYLSGVKKFNFAIESLMKLGIDIDHQDVSGKTALHYAVLKKNVSGVKALLKCGADVNILDSDGESAYSYLTEYINERCEDEEGVLRVLFVHVEKLCHLGLEVSECNRNLAEHTRKIWVIEGKLQETLSSKIERIKTLNIENTSMSLFDFLSETGAVSLYPFLLESTQGQIDDFFKSIDFKKLGEVEGIIKLQFRKMKARTALINSALFALRALLGFSFPGLCEEITRFLSNADLKNLISALEIENR